MARYTGIKGLSDERRLPRLGKIRLGVKVKKQGKDNRCQHDARTDCHYCTYPREVDYFVVPPEVAKALGDDKPKRLDVMLPREDQASVMPTAYKYYKRTGLFCTGNGESATRRGDDGQLLEIECPCDFLDQPGKCRRMAVINVVIPQVNFGGVYQIVTGSWNSIVDFQSGMDHVRELIGRCSWVPLVLERSPTAVQHVERKKGAEPRASVQTHYTMRLTMDQAADADFINRLKAETTKILTGPRYVLPPPDTNPALDAADLIEHDPERTAKTDARVVDKPASKKPQASSPPPPPPSPPKTPAAPPKKSEPPAAKAVGKMPEHAKALWNLVERVYGDRAQDLWTFLGRDYFRVKLPSDLTVEQTQPVAAELERIAGLSADECAEAGTYYWRELHQEASDRAVAANA